MIEYVTWALPNALELYKSRADVMGGLERLRQRLFGGGSRVAITGLPGGGKTVLFDHLSGRAFRQGYAPLPEHSVLPEKGIVQSGKTSVDTIVVPGDRELPSRLDALEQAFEPGKTVDGIIHVVAHGFYTRRIITAGLALDAYLDEQRTREVKALEEICELIRKAHRKQRKPAWLMLAVAKCDLFHTSLEAAFQHYAEPTSPIPTVLADLQGRIGADYFQWDACPVSSWLSDFRWGDETVAHQFDLAQRDHYLGLFAERLSKLREVCHGR